MEPCVYTNLRALELTTEATEIHTVVVLINWLSWLQSLTELVIMGAEYHFSAARI